MSIHGKRFCVLPVPILPPQVVTADDLPTLGVFRAHVGIKA